MLVYCGMSTTIQPLLTVKDACTYLQCTVKYLERAVHAGRLRALKPTRKLLRFRQADLDKFLDSGETMEVKQ